MYRMQTVHGRSGRIPQRRLLLRHSSSPHNSFGQRRGRWGRERGVGMGGWGREGGGVKARKQQWLLFDAKQPPSASGPGFAGDGRATRRPVSRWARRPVSRWARRPVSRWARRQHAGYTHGTSSRHWPLAVTVVWPAARRKGSYLALTARSARPSPQCRTSHSQTVSSHGKAFGLHGGEYAKTAGTASIKTKKPNKK